ncbi:MAG: ATP-dependent Clp protease ATP-binding subunit, partial [Lachnospiraceae bacterium]|nr:ATP-dependent Clp protease ATP-binding subunit [Lachnospiraceae bacterium]
VGAQRIVEPKKLGFNTDTSAESDYLKMKDGVMEEVKKLFRPELLNRIDEILVFRQLGREDVGAILDNQLADLQKRTQAGLGISFGLTASAKDYLVTKGYDPKYGARPLRRAIQTELEDLLAQEALGGNIKSGETVTVTLDKKTGRLSIKARAAR